MILPSKHLPPNRSLIGIGADILQQLDEPRTASELWELVRAGRSAARVLPALAFDEFILSLTLLNAIAAVELRDGLVSKVEVAS